MAVGVGPLCTAQGIGIIAARQKWSRIRLANMPPCLIHRGLRLKGAQGRSTARQARGEHRALAQFARHRHIAAHHARELARNGQPEASAAEALRSRGSA